MSSVERDAAAPTIKDSSTLLTALLLLCFMLSVGVALEPMIPYSASSSHHDRTLKSSSRGDSPNISDTRKYRPSVIADSPSSLRNAGSETLILPTSSRVFSGDRENGLVYGRRNPNSPSIDYGESHPFEIMERGRHQRRRHLREWHDGFHDYWYDKSFNVNNFLNKSWYDADDDYDPTTMYDIDVNAAEAQDKFDLKHFRPIRIKVDTRFLDQSSSQEKKDEFFEYHVLPAAVQFWTKALMVYPAKRLFVSDNDCGLGNPSHRANGINDADLMLYVSANRYCDSSNTGGTLASAYSCDWDQYDRPIGGEIDFCYDEFFLDANGNADSNIKRIMIEVAIHEIGHVLGVDSGDMAFYYDRATGLPRTPRPLNKSDDAECVNGIMLSQMNSNDFRPSPSTLKYSGIYPGIKFYEVVTPTVQRIAQNHFNCSSMSGMRLENQPSAGSCFGDHWEERTAWDSSMSGISSSLLHIPEHISPFTLALLEDSGWYRANYKMSKGFTFGRGAGCDFLEKPCIVDGMVPDYAAPYFCNNTKKEDADVRCDPTHHMMATCDLYDLSKEENVRSYPPVPQVYRYFPNPAFGPKHNKADYCPIYSETIMGCHSEYNSKTFPEESFNNTSRCYNSNYRPFCFETSCSKEDNAIIVKVGDKFEKCEYDFQKIRAPFAGESIYFECPRKAAICPELVCPSSCSGKGTCDWKNETPTCVCDGGVTSEDCLVFDKTFSRYGTATGDHLDADLQNVPGNSSSPPRINSEVGVTLLFIFVSYLALFKSIS